MDLQAVKQYLQGLQQQIVDGLSSFDGKSFERDEWVRPQGGGGISCLIEDGHFFERGGVLFSHVQGDRLPPSASASRPEIAGRRWEAMGVSLVLHPRNPYCPTVHLNVRFFCAMEEGAETRMVVWGWDGFNPLLWIYRRCRAFSSNLCRCG